MSAESAANDGLAFAFVLLPLLFLEKTAANAWSEWLLKVVLFGPIGVSALFYGMMILNRSGHEIAWTAGSLVVCASILGHGLSAAPAARLYRKYYG